MDRQDLRAQHTRDCMEKGCMQIQQNCTAHYPTAINERVYHLDGHRFYTVRRRVLFRVAAELSRESEVGVTGSVESDVVGPHALVCLADMA